MQTDGVNIHKIPDKPKEGEVTKTEQESKENEITLDKVDGSDSKEEKDIDNDDKKKKVHFQLVITMYDDELAEKNLHIDIENNDNELNTDMIDSSLDINNSADTDILDSSGELPLSQMPRWDPYVLNKSTDDSTISVDSASVEKATEQNSQEAESEGTETEDTDVNGSTGEEGSCDTQDK